MVPSGMFKSLNAHYSPFTVDIVVVVHASAEGVE